MKTKFLKFCDAIKNWASRHGTTAATCVIERQWPARSGRLKRTWEPSRELSTEPVRIPQDGFTRCRPRNALKEVAPKVIGALNLLAELGENPPKLIVGLTSIIGITGMQGNGWYAFSNEALDLILRRYASNHPATRTLSVAYSIWRDEGMGARMGSVQALKKKGIDAIPTEEGVRRFVRLFRHNPGTHQVLVTARMTQMDTIGTPAPPPIKGARFLEKRIHFTPGVESAFWVHLSLDEDLYLQDHCYNDSYLFPAVFGLEAMAQAVAHVTGVTGFRGVRVENLVLRRPVIVDPEKGADIIIWAQTRERGCRRG